MILKFRVYEQTISLQATKSEPRQGSKDYLELQFSFSPDWNDLLKYVYLQHGEVSVPHDLEDGSVIVDEYFTEQTEFNVTLFGKSADGSIEVPTNVVTVFLKESNNLWEKDAPEPQNSWFVQVADARNDALAAAIRAENAAIHQPYPNEETGTWWVWSAETGKYEDTGESYGVGGGTSDHTELSNRDAADQHPMSAITGLEDALGKKLPASELPDAVNAALEQAKASGEFDGKDGQDGVSVTHSWNGTVLTVTSASGTSSADLKGDKGDTGADGKTPVKGTDYFTNADKQEIAEAAAELVDVPTTLPTPNKLTFTGAVNAQFDGSEAVTVNIPSGGSGGGVTSVNGQTGDVTVKSGIPIAKTTGNGSTYEVTIPDITELYDGLRITIIPHVSNSSTAPYIKINDLEETRIFARRTKSTDHFNAGFKKYSLSANKPITLTYSGSPGWGGWVPDSVHIVDVNSISGVIPTASGGTGLNYLDPGSYIVGNGTSEVNLKTPAQVLADILPATADDVGKVPTVQTDGTIALQEVSGSGGGSGGDTVEVVFEDTLTEAVASYIHDFTDAEVAKIQNAKSIKFYFNTLSSAYTLENIVFGVYRPNWYGYSHRIINNANLSLATRAEQYAIQVLTDDFQTSKRTYGGYTCSGTSGNSLSKEQAFYYENNIDSAIVKAKDSLRLTTTTTEGFPVGTVIKVEVIT